VPSSVEACTVSISLIATAEAVSCLMTVSRFGILCSPSPLSSPMIAYVHATDLFFPTLTVREHLTFHGMVRVPSSVPVPQRMQVRPHIDTTQSICIYIYIVAIPLSNPLVWPRPSLLVVLSPLILRLSCLCYVCSVWRRCCRTWT
jgi:hypothetical protein